MTHRNKYEGNMPMIENMADKIRAMIASDGRNHIFWHLALRMVLAEVDEKRAYKNCSRRSPIDLMSQIDKKE